MTFPLSAFQPYLDQGLIQKSQKGSLLLFNYTPKCVFQRAWDPLTLSTRGLIYHEPSQQLIARPFRKFFNLNEMEESQLQNLPLDVDETPEVTEKMDGSLGILYWYDQKPWISTRGSLQSEQSQWATLFFRKHWGKLPIPQDWTLLFEIIYPENRIVINYGERQTLVLLAAIHTESAQEMPYSELQSFAQQFHFELVTRLPFSIPELCVWIPKLPYNQEGFVVHYPKSHLRVKFKGEAYLKLHKILNQITPKNIWKTMIEGKVSLPYLQEIPEEFRTWSLHLQENLESDYEKRKQEVQHLFQSLPPFSTRAQFAEHVKTKYPQFAPLLFALLDQNPKKIDFLLHKAMQPKELQESRFTDEV